MLQSNYVLPQSWAFFINQLNPIWSWYVHLTFRGFPHPERAIKTWNVFITKLNRESYGRRFREKNKGVVWVRATELQERGCPHFHAVIGMVPREIRRLDYKDLWSEIAEQ